MHDAGPAAAAAGRRRSRRALRSPRAETPAVRRRWTGSTSSRNSMAAAVGTEVRQADRTCRAQSRTATRGKWRHVDGQRVWPRSRCTTHKREPPLEEHALAVLVALQHRRRVVWEVGLDDERLRVAPNAAPGAAGPAVHGLGERPIDGQLHRHVPVGRAARARVPAPVIGVDAQRRGPACKLLSINELWASLQKYYSDAPAALLSCTG